MCPEHYRTTFKSLKDFYHNVSDKHIGELSALPREDLPGECKHPTFPGAVHGAARGALIPDVHAAQFLACDVGPGDNKSALNVWKDKWWRGNGWKEAVFRNDYINHMRKFQNRVWNPTDESGLTSRRCKITWHSLDSLVWKFVTNYPGEFEGCNFGDVDLYFCRLPQFTHVRQHSTSGSPWEETYEARRSSSASR